MAPSGPVEGWIAERLRVLGHASPGLPPRPDHAVVGFDGSETSLAAAEWASHIANELRVVTGLEIYTGLVAAASSAPVTTVWHKQVEADVSSVLPELAHRVGQARFRHEFSKRGALRAVEHAARDERTSLIAVGHAGKGKLGRLVLGSVSEALAHHAPQSVLVAKGRYVEGPIVAGVADDAGSAYAAAWAAGLARWLGRPFILAHCVPDRRRTETIATGPDGARFDLAAWPPEEGLVQCAKDEHAPLMVVGHGHMPGWLGSTAIRVLRQAPMSVLVARPWARHQGLPR